MRKEQGMPFGLLSDDEKGAYVRMLCACCFATNRVGVQRGEECALSFRCEKCFQLNDTIDVWYCSPPGFPFVDEFTKRTLSMVSVYIPKLGEFHGRNIPKVQKGGNALKV